MPLLDIYYIEKIKNIKNKSTSIPRLFHLRYKYRHSIPYPVHYESGKLTMLYIKELFFFQKSKIHYFWCRKRKSLVKLIDTYLISSAMPFFLSDLFLRSLSFCGIYQDCICRTPLSGHVQCTPTHVQGLSA